MDTNKDGAIDLKEAVIHLKHLNLTEELANGELPEWFKDMDTNNDGLIQPLELDADFHQGGEEPESENLVDVLEGEVEFLQ